MKTDVNIKGKISELEVLTKVTKLGYSVSIPFGDKDKYDQIWDINNKLLRIQVKTARWKNDEHTGIVFNCYSVSNGKKHQYTKQDIDYFAVHWDNKCYLLPVEVCSSNKTLWLIPKNNPSCCLAKDYILEEVLKKI